MQNYKAPIRELVFVLKELLNYEELSQTLGFEDAGLEMLESILPEAARFMEEVVAPTNQASNQQGTTVKDGQVIPPPALDGVYSQYAEAGWVSLNGDPQYGGAGFPQLADMAVQEMLQSANLSFGLMPLLTNGVVHALELYATDDQKARFLPHLVTGKWAGTMNLTEPQAGTDLGRIKTRAVKTGDHYLISGQKIFITWGDQNYTDNIIHLVLARTPDAPEGTKGISMFIVPKYLINEDGSIGERNDLQPVGVEHKMGIHASPTCTMQYGDNGGAVGYRVGEENRGLTYMFAMMNAARLAVGHQGVAIGERAYQQAVAYASERIQGEIPGGSPDARIIQHPDVKRMLIHMRAMNEAGRALSLLAQASEDKARRHPDVDTKAACGVQVDVLTPLVKAWCTEAGVEVASLGVQVHGGTGYIEETGATQHLRDARILPIYEGTNGIQALDFVGRKTLRDQGQGVMALLQQCTETVESLKDADGDRGAFRDKLAKAIGQCQQALKSLAADPEQAPAVAFNFMMLFGNTVCGWLMVKSACIALDAIDQGSSERFYVQKIATAEYFLSAILPRNSACLSAVEAGTGRLGELTAEDFVTR
jgi:3-(methylsulfanyl)propanoyl-CoA dehydrogenase